MLTTSYFLVQLRDISYNTSLNMPSLAFVPLFARFLDQFAAWPLCHYDGAGFSSVIRV